MSIKCEACSKDNRDIAKYCKHCGTKIIKKTGFTLEDIVGADTIKNEIKALIEISKAMIKSGIDPATLNKHIIIMGKTGTGKTTFAKVLQQIFFENGIIKKDEAKILDAVDYPPFTKDFEKNIAKVKDGILFIDNVHTLISGKNDSDIHSLSKLFSEMDKFGNNPIIVLAGQQEEFEDFLFKNPQIKNRFEYQFKLNESSAADLLRICKKKLEKAGLSLNEESKNKLLRLFKYNIKTKDETFGNGHFAAQKSEDLIKSYYLRISKTQEDTKQIIPDDIKGYIPEERSIDDIFKELDEFVGMTEVKQAVREIAERIKNQKERAEFGHGNEQKFGGNIILTGNPGTGKTTVARKLGMIFEAIGFLDRGHVIEVDRSSLVTKYANQTAEEVNKICNRAMGGILFVDEAYTLTPDIDSGTSDKAGKEAVETLMKRMEDDRGKFSVIAAGYKDEMQRFLTINPGMVSRIDKQIHIEDYTPDELYQIYLMFLKKQNFTLEEDAHDKLKLAVKDIYNKRDKSFANAREMRKLCDDTLSKMSIRISQLPADQRNESVYTTIKAEDIPYEAPKELTIDEILEELNEFVGMESIKNEIRKLVSYIDIEKQRKGEEGEKKTIDQHFVFTGNPGTGKTTVARLLGKIFKTLGILPKGHVVEADRSKLVALHAGNTGRKTNDLIDSAFGGILFIDEAYTLSQGSRDTFGKTAIDTLLKRVEDDKGKFIAIVAGYTEEMRQFLDTNPGLPSRFNKTIHFEDYNSEELDSIFKGMIKKNGFVLDDNAEQNSIHFFTDIYLSKDKNFGNARAVRNIFDTCKLRQSERLSKISVKRELTDSELKTITLEDIQGKVKEVKTVDQIMRDLDSFVGMQNVKQAIREIADDIQMRQRKVQQGLMKAEKVGKHFVITGNPGTGKTTIARKLGQIFKAIKFLSTDKVIEVDRSKLVSKYSNESADLVNDACDRAMGGILFIDEAYTLAPDLDSGSSDKAGKEAIETLMKRMEDDKGKFVVIAAGYKEEMDRFINVNPGMRSRIDEYLHISDYEPDELFEIFTKMAEGKNYTIAPDAEDKIYSAVKDIYNKRVKDFANAREVRKLLDSTLTKQSSRLMKMPEDQVTPEDYMTLLAEDIPYETETEQTLEEIFGELNDLIGLSSVKDNLKQLAEFVKMEKMRSVSGGKSTTLNLHYVFSGNPGTGKTTVARLLGKIFKTLGLLSRGHLVEADRSKFIGQYKGTTDKKTHALIDSALGGLLFIDEAYTLVQGNQDDYGQVAISTLLKRLEDDKGKFIAVIAGYTDKMKGFLEQNEGLPSRFTQHIDFPDYKPEELSAIFRLFVNKKNMKLSEDAEQNIDQFFTEYYEKRDKYFGNARDVRNIFEHALQKQGTRLFQMSTGSMTDDDINTLTFEDIKL